MGNKEKVIPAKKGEGGICFGPHAPRTIVLYPYKIDKEGTIHIRAIVKSKCKGYMAKMKPLVAMGMLSKDVLEFKKGFKEYDDNHRIVK